MKQFIAGSVIDNLFDLLGSTTTERASAQKLAKWLSHFQLKSKSKFENNDFEYKSNFSVIINLLQRGYPTKLNFHAFESLVERSNIFKFNTKDENAYSLNIENSQKEIADLVYRSLHIIDPRISLEEHSSTYQQSWERLGSEFEEDFLYNKLPNSFRENGSFIIQLMASQRTIRSIVSENYDFNTLREEIQNNFVEQRTDFSIEFPYYGLNKPKGIVVEIDGSQHQSAEQQYLDIKRDQAVVHSGWNNTIRIKTSEFRTNQIFDKIRSLFIPAIENEYIKITADNYTNPLWDSELGLEVLQLTLIPFGISRLQRAYIEFLIHNESSLKDISKIKIAVIERDVPCAKLAMDDLNILIQSLSQLSSEKYDFPDVELEVFSTSEFINSKYQFANVRLISDFDWTKKYDLLIDISILDRNENQPLILSNSDEIITIRSVHYLTAKRKVATNSLINYHPFCNYLNDQGTWEIADSKFKEGIDYLLKSIFRKKEFRPGQLPIMHNALQCKSVIGLLPTGGGKSLTYQISALLQPGICLVIDPIRSLMKDQVDGLNRNLIDSCVFINSTLRGEAKREAMRQLAEGEVQFAFVSPERLQMEEFRLLLNEMFNKGHYFSYCVIDEVHCVSEWGHDFRTAYLRLGESAMSYCKTKDRENITLFGLTATASYDVLADVQRELSGNDESKLLSEEAIVRSEYTKRNELQYIIEEVTIPMTSFRDTWALKREVSSKKKEKAQELLTTIPEKISELQDNYKLVFSDREWEHNENNEQQSFNQMRIEEYDAANFYQKKNAGLIFCPHTKGSLGVTDRFKNVGAAMREGFFDVLSTQPDINAGFFMGSGNDSDGISQVIQEESFNNQDKFIVKA